MNLYLLFLKVLNRGLIAKIVKKKKKKVTKMEVLEVLIRKLTNQKIKRKLFQRKNNWKNNC